MESTDFSIQRESPRHPIRWAEGQFLSLVLISSNLADQARTKLKALPEGGIAYNNLAASNILVQAQDPHPRVHLIDLSASITLPHVQFSPSQVKATQQKVIQLLEVGFALLSKLPINQGLCVADLSSSDKTSLRDVIAESEFI